MHFLSTNILRHSFNTPHSWKFQTNIIIYNKKSISPIYASIILNCYQNSYTKKRTTKIQECYPLRVLCRLNKNLKSTIPTLIDSHISISICSLVQLVIYFGNVSIPQDFNSQFERVLYGTKCLHATSYISVYLFIFCIVCPKSLMAYLWA